MELPNSPDATDSKREVEVDLQSLDRERRVRGWSKQDLAQRASLKPSTISEVYRTRSASIGTFAKIARAFEAHQPIEGADRLLAEVDTEAGAA